MLTAPAGSLVIWDDYYGIEHLKIILMMLEPQLLLVMLQAFYGNMW